MALRRLLEQNVRLQFQAWLDTCWYNLGRNPYGTPQSFSLHSPQGLASFNQRENAAIPESPFSRETSLTDNPPLSSTERDLGKAKSMSPELDISVHEISATSFKARDILDPIETDEEKPQEVHNSPRVGRLKGNVSTPSTSSGGNQSSHGDTGPVLPTFSHLAQAENMQPIDLELLNPNGRNRPSTPVNTVKEAPSPIKATQETTHGSAERLPGEFRHQSFPMESQDQAGAALERASIINEQIRSTPKNPLESGIQRAHSVENPPSPPQTGRLPPVKVADLTFDVPYRDHTGERKQFTPPKDYEKVLVDSSLGRNTKDKKLDNTVAVSELKIPKSPENSKTGALDQAGELLIDRCWSTIGMLRVKEAK